MAKVTIGGVDYEVRPFKFRELRKAAPAIDRIGARARSGAVGGLVGTTEGVADILEVLAIGIDGKSADDLEADLSMTEFPGLQKAFADLLAESGLKPAGERGPAPPPSPADPAEGRSQSRSTTSSPSSSAPDAEIGNA